MPDETLTDRLDALRDLYLQRQRAGATLQASFKAVTNAHSKAQKSLRDFASQNAGLDVGAAQAAFAQTRLKEEAVDPLLPDLRRDFKSLAVLTGALRDAGAALRTEPVDVVRLAKANTLLATSKEQDVADLLPDLNRELDLAQRSLGDEFGARLRTALAEQGVQIGGRAPKFELGRFELEADFARRFIVLRYGRDVVVPHAPVTVEAAIRAYQAASKLVSGRTQDGNAWLNQFHEAYEIVRRRREVTGTRVNIVECYVEMVILRQGRAFSIEPGKRTFIDYMRAQFNYDFYEFAERRRPSVGNLVRAHVATKSHTENPAKSMWIVEGDGPYDGRYIADVEFAKD